MGYARILSGGTDGRYTIELDYGSGQKTALLAALSTLLGQLDTAIGTQQALIAEAEVKEAAQLIKVQAAQDEVIAQSSGGLPPGSPRPDTQGFKFALAQLATLQKKHAPLRLKLEALKFDRAQAQRRVAYWTNLNPVETRSAWCADLTEEAAAGSYVATADLPGESNLIVLAPGCRPWVAGDGLLTAREIMSPAQAFLNAAILPGWQKFFPTYRWGTCTAIDEEADTMSVSLASQPSSAQSLGINQASTLTGVPVVYMTCNAGAFEVGDRVVVQFVGQNWSGPRVIGFLDTPKPCGNYVCTYAQLITVGTVDVDYYAGYFYSVITSTAATNSYDNLYSACQSRTLVVEAKVDSGSWQTMTQEEGLAFDRYKLESYDSLTTNTILFSFDANEGRRVNLRLAKSPAVSFSVVEIRATIGEDTVNLAAALSDVAFQTKTLGGINLDVGSEPCTTLNYVLNLP